MGPELKTGPERNIFPRYTFGDFNSLVQSRKQLFRYV